MTTDLSTGFHEYFNEFQGHNNDKHGFSKCNNFIGDDLLSQTKIMLSMLEKISVNYVSFVIKRDIFNRDEFDLFH